MWRLLFLRLFSMVRPLQMPSGLILELKAGHSPEEAIRQIREKQYALRFKGKPGEKERYTEQILGVGISYDKDTKEHHCKIEQL